MTLLNRLPTVVANTLVVSTLPIVANTLPDTAVSVSRLKIGSLFLRRAVACQACVCCRTSMRVGRPLDTGRPRFLSNIPPYWRIGPTIEVCLGCSLCVLFVRAYGFMFCFEYRIGFFDISRYREYVYLFCAGYGIVFFDMSQHRACVFCSCCISYGRF